LYLEQARDPAVDNNGFFVFPDLILILASNADIVATA